MRQQYNLGVQMRKEYIQLKKLIFNNSTTSQLYVRSTYKNRTIQSLNSFMYGLFGENENYKLSP